MALSNTNTYSGVTSIDGGVLRLDSAGALPGGIAATGGTSNLTFNGGVLGLATGDFKRSLNIATTANAVTFTGPGGWAAYGADRLVNLGGASASITPGTAGTGFNGKVLILGAASATHMVTLQNPLALGASYTIQVDDGAAPIDATLSGVVSGPWPIIKTGAGTLALSAANTNVLGGNPTQVTAGTLLVNGSLTAASNYVVVLRGATLGGSGSISGFVSVTSGASLQPTVTGTPGTLTLASSTSPAFYPDTKLKIRATSATALDKVSLTNANAVFTCGNLDLVIDCSSLSSTVVNQTIVQTTHAAGISGKFHSVTANNGYTAWVNYNANSITVILSSGAGPATTLQMTGFPSPQIAGVAGSVTVTAKDSIGIPATGYTGTIHFSSTDGAAAGLPADYTFVPGDGGTHTFTGVTLNTIGTQAITATDTVNSSLTATQSNISITGNPDKAMLTFTFPTWGAAAISGTNMSLIVPIGTPVTSLAPTYTVSPLATCLPASGTALDFTAPQTYTVTAQDNSTQVFTVSVTAGNAPVNFSWAAANSGNWSVAGNWTNEVALAPLVTAGQTNYTLSFNQSGSYTATNDLPAGFLLNQLNFGAATGTITLAGTNSLALTANDLTLPIIHQNSAAAVIIDPPISLASNTDFGGTGTGQVDLAGVISGTGSLTKDGPGTLKIYGLTPNTYSGGTIINSGTLHLGTMVSGISPSCTYTMGTGPVTLNGGTIEFDRVTAANALTSNGGTIVSPNGWGATWSGHVTLNAILTINSTSASPLNFTGGMSGSGGLIKMGNRTTILTGALTYTGNTTVNAGILSINSAFLADTSTVTIATGAQLDLNTAGASDTVATLVLGGVTVPPGTYNSLNPTYGAYFTGTGSLVVPVLGTPFELWAINHGLSGTDALPGADPDHDGLTNAMEFVLGGEPNPANAGANSLGLLPKPTRNLADDLVFTFPRSIASKSGASVNFQWSTDLSFPTGNDALVGVVSTAADAHGVTVDVTPGALGTDPDTIVITVPVANAPGGKVFGRLHVTVP